MLRFFLSSVTNLILNFKWKMLKKTSEKSVDSSCPSPKLESKYSSMPNRLDSYSLKKSNEMQQYADIYLLLNYSTCFGRPSRPSSRVHKTVVAASGDRIWASFLKRDQIFGHVWGSLLPRLYDLYQRLQLQFYVLLMMGAMDARNM